MVELDDFREMPEVCLDVNKRVSLIDVILFVVRMRSNAILPKDILLFFKEIHLACFGQRSNLVLKLVVLLLLLGVFLLWRSLFIVFPAFLLTLFLLLNCLVLLGCWLLS